MTKVWWVSIQSIKTIHPDMAKSITHKIRISVNCLMQCSIDSSEFVVRLSLHKTDRWCLFVRTGVLHHDFSAASLNSAPLVGMFVPILPFRCYIIHLSHLSLIEAPVSVHFIVKLLLLCDVCHLCSFCVCAELYNNKLSALASFVSHMWHWCTASLLTTQQPRFHDTCHAS